MSKQLAPKKSHAHEALTRFVPGRRPPPFLTEPANFHLPIDPVREARNQAVLQPIPRPRRLPPVMGLDEVIGAAAVQDVEANGQIVFHAVGDTGRGGHSAQTAVVDAMTLDFHRPNPADHPAFWFHLGDVIYGHNKELLFRDQFYGPNQDYPAKIVAIPGNHDGEVFANTDPKSLAAFQENFVAAERVVLPIAGSQTREAMTQPGVYFLLECPFVRILGLYSNVAENPGYLSGGKAGKDQKDFLVSQLEAIAAKRKNGDTDALIVAVHHPPYSGGGHSGSQEMLADLDDAFHKAKIAPDVVLAAHAHNYQRYTRDFPLAGGSMEIPFLVAGGGGHGLTPIRTGPDRQPVQTPLEGDTGDHRLMQYYNGYGYLLVTATRKIVTLDFHPVPSDCDAPLDSVTVDLTTHKIVDETAPLVHPLPGEVGHGGTAFGLWE
jgi:hypothetical protein